MYNGYPTQRDFWDAMDKAYTDPYSDYQMYLHERNREAIEAGREPDYTYTVLKPEGWKEPEGTTYESRHGDILGGSGE